MGSELLHQTCTVESNKGRKVRCCCTTIIGCEGQRKLATIDEFGSGKVEAVRTNHVWVEGGTSARPKPDDGRSEIVLTRPSHLSANCLDVTKRRRITLRNRTGRNRWGPQYVRILRPARVTTHRASVVTSRRRLPVDGTFCEMRQNVKHKIS